MASDQPAEGLARGLRHVRARWLLRGGERPPAGREHPRGPPAARAGAGAAAARHAHLPHRGLRVLLQRRVRGAARTGSTAGYSYSRIDNPTADAFAIAVAALEGQRLPGPTVAQAFASGMAAISTVFWAFTGAGAHVVAPAARVRGHLRVPAPRGGQVRGAGGFRGHDRSGSGARGAAAGDQDRVRGDAGQPDDGRGRPARPGRDRAPPGRAAGGGLHPGAPRWCAGRWNTARTWCCTRRPSTSAATRTRPAGWWPGRPG